MKLEDVDWHPFPAVTCTAILTGGLLLAALKITQMYSQLAIDTEEMVRGDLSVTQAAARSAPARSVDIISENEAVIPVSSR